MTDRLSPSQHVLQYFSHSHLPEPLQAIVRPIADLAIQMEHSLPDGPEKTAAMRKLLEAKDAFVRANLSVDRPWWQTSDLKEVSSKLDIYEVSMVEHPANPEAKILSVERAEDGVPTVDRNPGAAERYVRVSNIFNVQPPPAGPPTLPEDIAEATLQRKADNERAQAKATNVVDGHCYGPVALSDPENGFQEAICFHNLCSWERRGIVDGTKSLQELQQAHNDAQMPLVD